MQTTKKASIALAVAAVAVFGAAPAFAKHHHRVVHQVARLSPAAYQQGLDSYGDIRSTPERDAALRECNDAAQKYSDSSWESTKSAVYATCMTNHGQMP